PDQKENLGYILHCKNCGHRKTSTKQEKECKLCNSKISVAGPLWIGNIFDREFIQNMLVEIPNLKVDKVCEKTIQKCLAESEMPATYFTLDEIASKMKISPPKLEKAIQNLEQNNFTASVTAFNPTGFRTSANINEITKIFQTNQ
ncbi:MAG: tRNA (guanine-N1)-methyltransferase, partial [Nitrosopumilus sp.]|nr:tRNA (guanine-N1)-methyltransferase [Nitrosopumilus sp.]